MLKSLVEIDLTTILSLIYLAFVASIIGYGIWGSLLGRYETWRVAPLSLLVPVVGLASAALLLDETLSALQLCGAGLILACGCVGRRGCRVKAEKSPALAGQKRITGRGCNTARLIRRICRCQRPCD